MYFSSALQEKRRMAIEKIRKHMIKKWLYKNQEIIAPF
jgi:hypothetical protein